MDARGIFQGMKPGNGTIETLTNHVLNFETSRQADRERNRLNAIDVEPYVSKVRDPVERLTNALGAMSIRAEGVKRELLRRLTIHRELRRAARRLAKAALRQAEELRESHAECDALCTRIVKLEAEIDRLSGDNWDDRELSREEEEAIHEAFPTRSGRHELYAEAMRLVGAKRSKGELVKLVNWLLHRAQPPSSTNDVEAARAFLWHILGQSPPTNHVAELARMLTRARAQGERAA